MVTRAALLLFLVACGGGDGGGSLPYEKLSQYGFFEGDGHTQKPKAGVVPYAVNAPLFADFAGKDRFLVLPKGGKIGYAADDKWTFPDGTFIVKTFGYGDRLIETRVLIKQADGWLPTTYIWNDAQTEATLELGGSIVNVTAVDDKGTQIPLAYRVPNQNQCFGCHGQPGATNVLGVRTRQMNHSYDYGAGPENQIDHLTSLGAFAGSVPGADQRAALPDPYGSAGTVDTRARAWLEANCAHCHNPDGQAGGTHLWLTTDVTTAIDYGVCRIPNAAGDGSGGHRFDVVPGKPDDSIMTFRISSTTPGIKMPAMPIQLVDQKGVDLIKQWIAQLPGGCPG